MLVEVIDKVLGLVPQNPETSIKASVLAKDVLLHQWPASNIIKVRNPLSSHSSSLQAAFAVPFRATKHAFGSTSVDH